MTTANMVLCPAYVFEAKGFNPSHQSKNWLVREVVARVVAVAAPLLYLYQVGLHGAVSVVDVVLLLPEISPGILCQSSIPSFSYSCRNLASSLCEMPQKILLGPHCQPNYFGDARRYERINYLSTIGKNLI